MKKRAGNHMNGMAVLMVLCFFVCGCPSGGSGGGGPQSVTEQLEQETEGTVTSSATDLETFNSCEDLESYLKGEAIARMESAVDANEYYDGLNILDESDFSTTNVQVEGVDEADFVKNDADYIYVLSNGYLIIYKARPGTETQEISRFLIEGVSSDMYIHNEMAVILSQVLDNKIKISILDIHVKESPELVRELYADGDYKSSRMIGDTVRVVLTKSMPYIGIQYWPTDVDPGKSMEEKFEALKENNRQIILGTAFSEWLPKYSEVLHTSGGLQSLSGELIECSNFYRPQDPSGSTILSILTIDLNDPMVHQNDIALVADVSHVYASQENLYVSSSSGQGLVFIEAAASPVVESVKIHKFDIHSDPAQALYMATGEVDGRLLNQYSMDEYNGFLRVATTEGYAGDGSATNNLFVLEEDQGELKTVGEIRGIAPTEELYSARFMGDRGYLVTFVNIDPLITLDLSNPYQPKIAGELKVPGYSTYIHPLDENHLLAIGKDAEDMGTFAWYQGVQLSLFDVSDPSNPVQMHKVIIGSRGTESQALYDPKAFNYFASRNLLAVPIALYEGWTGGSDNGDYSSTGLHLYHVTPEAGFEFLGMVDHTQDGCLAGEFDDCSSYPRSSLQRSVIIDDTIFSISNLLMRVSGLDDLSQLVEPLVFKPTNKNSIQIIGSSKDSDCYGFEGTCETPDLSLGECVTLADCHEQNPDLELSPCTNLMCLDGICEEVGISGCEYGGGEVTLHATVHQTDIEGGCWYFDTGDPYIRFEALNLVPSDLFVDGLEADIIGNIRKDYVTTCQIGQVFEVISFTAKNSTGGKDD